MTKSPDVFKRKEVKYHLSRRQYTDVLRALDDKMALDEYGQTIITSVYYDTYDWALIERSLDKPLYKEKLRIRVYGTRSPLSDTPAFIEIKTKFKGIVYKRRVPCTYDQAHSFLEQTSLKSGVDELLRAEIVQGNSYYSQVLCEIESLVQCHGALSPSMALSCIRSAWTPCAEQGIGTSALVSCVRQSTNTSSSISYAGQNTNDSAVLLDKGRRFNGSSDLRITFDSEITWRDLRLARHARVCELLGKEERIMEIKTSGACPLWLVQILNDSKVYPTSFSKYGSAYKARMNVLERGTCA